MLVITKSEIFVLPTLKSVLYYEVQGRQENTLNQQDYNRTRLLGFT